MYIFLKIVSCNQPFPMFNFFLKDLKLHFHVFQLEEFAREHKVTCMLIYLTRIDAEFFPDKTC